MPHHLLLSHCLVLQYFLIIYNPQTHTRLFSLHHPESLPFPMLSCFEMPYPQSQYICLVLRHLHRLPYIIIFVPSHSKSASLVSAISATTISVGSSANTVPAGTFTSKLTPMHAASAKPANLFVLLIFFLLFCSPYT